MPISYNLKNQVFGNLTALEHVKFYSKSNRAITKWKCLCRCGTITYVITNSLRTSKVISCGCLGTRPDKHGLTRKQTSKEIKATYHIWVSMKQRCLNPNAKEYIRYGGRGILICARWLDFENFYKDMGIKPKNLSLDRIDTNGNYEPGNCRWANIRTQSINRRGSNKTSIYKGVYYRKMGGIKKWRAQIGNNNNKKSLGSFEFEIDAARAYNEAALKIYGNDAYLNKV